MDHVITATTRTPDGKGAARKLRRTGQVPAIVYGPGGEPISISVDPKVLFDVFRISQDTNTVITLDIDGTKHTALVRTVQRHPVNREIRHVDFYRVDAARRVEVMVPLESTGKPAGAIHGGRVRLIRRAVKTRAPFDRIPKSFVIDTTPMDIGDMYKASQITTPEGVEVVCDNDFNVLTVYGKKAKGGGKPE